MACLVLRSTFRLHDNPALDRALADPSLLALYLPIDTARVLPPSKCLPTLRAYTAINDPKFVLGTLAHKHVWGYHQYAFLLLALRSFQRDVRTHLDANGRKDVRVDVCKGSVAALVSHIVRRRKEAASPLTVYIDRVDDPAWDTFDSALISTKGVKVRWVTTLTLLDWYDDPDCLEFLRTWRNRWRIPRSNQILKDYVVGRFKSSATDLPQKVVPPAARSNHRTGKSRGRRATRVRTRTTTTRSASPSAARGSKRVRRRGRGGGAAANGSTSTTTKRARSAPPRIGQRKGAARCAKTVVLDVDTEWQRWTDAMHQARLRPYDIVTEGLERYALAHLESTRRALAKPTWEKRLTNVSVGLRDHASAPEKDTSKLSPFFALGVLSPRWAFVQWWGTTAKARQTNESVPSSAVAQLLWRETFHAASRLPKWWTPRTKTLARPDRFWRHEPDEGRPYGGWRVWKSDDADPLYQGWLTATTGAPDLDESLVLLVTDGWVHHLRRHLIADYLTRGKVRADWMLGEQWFRQTLVDHDACVNRGNWMWLSASDFSVAQMRRHYGYKDYVQRHVYGEWVHPLPQTTGRTANVDADLNQTGGSGRKKGKLKRRSTRNGTPTKTVKKGSTRHTRASRNSKGLYGGYPDPRKRYDGHYKSPPAPVPTAAKVYARKAPAPSRHATTRRYLFSDHPGFDPDCAPYEVLAMGAFGGTYFRDIWSGVRNCVLSGEAALKELPSAWWKQLDKDTQLCSATYNKRTNYFSATCGGSLDMWESSGWINPIDPYGWFQWYCHFFQGRRTSDDARQIERWTKFTNPNGRFVKPLLAKCVRAKTHKDDANVSPVTRQNLLHWGRWRL